MTSPIVRIALCDDNADFRLLLSILLEAEPDFELVGEAADGAEAIAVAERAQPDVLLLDVAMPVMDGIEALPRIRAVSPETRVVMLTGFDTASVTERVLALGAARMIVKGLSPENLARSIREVCCG